MGAGVYPSWERREIRPFVPADARRILDVGCGPGGFGKTMSDRSMFGVEPNPDAAAQASSFYDEVYVGLFPDAAPQGEKFDCIVFNDVLEHMVEPEAALRAAMGFLSSGGHVVASIPNMRYAPVLRRLVFSADWTYEDSGVLDRTHVRWFTYNTMRALFVNAGYHVDALAPINRKTGWKTRLISSIPRFSDLAAQQFVVVARPRK